MGIKSRPRGARLAVLRLEDRTVPSASLVATFERAALGSMPDGWTSWASEESTAFQVANVSGSSELTTTGRSDTVNRRWSNDTSNDATVSVDVKLTTLVPTELIVRGRDLDGDAPTYYSATLTRGLHAELRRVENGQATMLATLDSAKYFSGEWVRVTLTATGDRLEIAIVRRSTGESLNAEGFWQSEPATALAATDAKPLGEGSVGLGRQARYAGAVEFADFAADAELNASWFSNDGGALTSGAIGLTSNGRSSTAARAWLSDPVAADATVRANVLADSLVPASILGRGAALDGDAPTYYAASITRGVEVELVRVVDGEAESLGRIESRSYVSGEWVTIALDMRGDLLRVGVTRVATGEYLNADGVWQSESAWAIETTDAAIRDGGHVGVGRAPRYAGPVNLDDFSIDAATAAIAIPTTPMPTSDLGLPEGWASAGGSIRHADDDPTALVASGDEAARAWRLDHRAGDVVASASLTLGDNASAGLLVRGRNLDGKDASYYAATLSPDGLELSRSVDGDEVDLAQLSPADWPPSAPLSVALEAVGPLVRLQAQRSDTGEYLGSDGFWQEAPAWVLAVSDDAVSGVGNVGVHAKNADAPVRFDGFAIIAAADDATVETSAPTPAPIVPQPAPVPAPPIVVAPTPASGDLPMVPRHHGHIRIAELAYHGTPLDEFAKNLLRNDVDLVVPNIAYLDDIAAVAPGTPQLIYTNTTNIYKELLTDWLAYADAHGLDREAAFYHYEQATAFRGDSSSSQPVDKFWDVTRDDGGKFADLTSAAHKSGSKVAFASRVGGALYTGYTDRFREMNVALSSGPRDGWAGVLEYVAATDADGNPTRWSSLPTLADGTARLTRSGQIAFDPPADWKTASIDGSDRLYFLRVRTTAEGVAPIASTIVGRDYVQAHGKTSGVVPAFDDAADANRDGYLNDAEYARRASGKDARFDYESRAPYPAYGQMRYATNPASAAFKSWAADFARRFLDAHPLAGGLFMDNSFGKLDIDPTRLSEPTANYAADYGTLLAKVGGAIGGRWVLANTAGARDAANPILAGGTSSLEEFGIRPLAHNRQQFEDIAAQVAQRRELADGKAYQVLDSYPAGGAPSDARTQLATLAYYYMVADPDTTFLMFNGGYNPKSSWTDHWSDAVRFDVGRPKGTWSEFATGVDPEKSSLAYKVYQRQYANALVLYKPLSYRQGVSGGLSDKTATTHDLGGTYRPLKADGTLGDAVTRVTLRNGEGAVLAKTV